MLKRGVGAGILWMVSLGLEPSSVTATLALRVPTAGTLQATPSFPVFGVDTSVNVTGSGWETFPEECQYDLLFDGVKKVQQGPDLGLFTQPNMTFTVPGATLVGVHTITVVLRGTFTGRTLPKDLPFEVRGGCITRMQIPELPTYLPEGDPAGDEMRPGNKITVLCSWTGGFSEETKRLTATLTPSRLPGQCTNSGGLNFEDFTIEAADNPSWDIEDGLVYDGVQNISATTKAAVPPDFTMPLIVTSYDRGGTCSIEVMAEECPAVNQDVPKDTDKDGLPDAFETAAKYFTAARELKTFDPNKAKSDGLQAGRDSDDDSDLDNRATPVHTTFGDGLTALEEYRAIKVKGAVKRTIDLDNDGPGGGKGGTHLKDFFVFDEKADKDTPFFESTNKFLEDFKLIWHVIDKGDMTAAGDKAGLMGKNGDGNQRAIWLHEMEKLSRPGRLAETDFMVSSGRQVDISFARIKAVSTKLDISRMRLLKFVVAHEIGHKLSLPHNSGERRHVAQKPATPNLTQYFETAQRRHLHFWVPVFVSKGGINPLELFDMLERSNSNIPVPAVAKDIGVPGVGQVEPEGTTLLVHGEAHRIGTYALQLLRANQIAGPAVIKVEAHAKNLLDPVPHPPDLEAIEGNPLDAEQEKKPNVKS